MATDHTPSGRRPHYHRGRRGADRRGNERRSQQQATEQAPRSSGDQVDVDQIMREIRSRISQRHGIELTPQQIQDLAGRRLEAILDPRTVNPTLFEQLRKGAATSPESLPQSADTESTITDDAIYAGGPMLRFFRRLLNPLLKLLFNPAPLIAAFQAQSRVNREAAARAVEREKRQTEWNALHYQVLQRLVTEVSRNSIETQALASRVEALVGRVDFNDRRIRSLESVPAPAPSRSPRTQETSHPAPAPPPAPAPAPVEQAAMAETPGSPTASLAPAGAPSDGQRRRRRRRRGRRGSTPAVEAIGGAAAVVLSAPDDTADGDTADGDDGDEEMQYVAEAAESTPVSARDAPVSIEPAATDATMSLQVTGPPEPAPQAPWPTPGPAPAPAEAPAAPAAESTDPGTSES